MSFVYSLGRVVWGWMSPRTEWLALEGNPAAPEPRCDSLLDEPCTVIPGVGSALDRNAFIPVYGVLAAVAMTVVKYRV